MDNPNAYEIIKESARKWPNKAVILDKKGVVTFAHLYVETESLKKTMQNLGVKEGIRLGIMCRNSREFIISAFAGWACGAIILPLSHQMKASELEQIIKATRLSIIIDDKSGVAPTLPNKQVISINGQELRLSRIDEPDEIKGASHVKNPAFIRFTSGTTGKSKGVIISHEGILERVGAANKELQLGEHDTVVSVLPMAFHFLVSIVLYVKYGVSIAICNDFLAAAILDCANAFNATLLYATPMHIKLLAHDTSRDRFKTLKKVISTSTSISTHVCDKSKTRFNLPVIQAYGIIEIGLPIINSNPEADSEAVGHALPDCQVEILDDNLSALEAGKTGMLAIKGPGMFDGYLLPPLTREEVLANGWFLTGDMAKKSADGLITIVGRKKAMINVSGNKVFPEEVENIIEIHPAVEACRVFGGSHIPMGEIVEAQIVLKEDIQVEPEDLILFCRERLSTYKVPQRLHFVQEIDITESGKKVRW